jgi:AMP-binding enzyme
MAHVWEKSHPSGVRWDTPLPPAVPLESLLETAATRWPDRIAIDFYDRTFTYRELHDLAARAAKGLQTLGVGPGVHVGLHLRNTPHFVTCFFAVLMAGGRVVNFSPLAAPRELTQAIVRLGVDAIEKPLLSFWLWDCSCIDRRRTGMATSKLARGHHELRDPYHSACLKLVDQGGSCRAPQVASGAPAIVIGPKSKA